jgi:dihydrofolate reductase
MQKLVASAWMTLDGIFDSDLMQQWFYPFDSEGRQNAIRESVLGSDAILMGRTTYELLAPYWSSLKNNEMGISDKLNNSPKYIVSSTLETADWSNSTIIRGKVIEFVSGLKRKAGREIRIEGSGTLTRSLMQAGLVDEYRLLLHPFIMGTGKRYFNEGLPPASLQLIRTENLGKGVISLHYANLAP